eukprot:1728886-Heterocapsa_arctica.AAC.1
MKAEDNSLNCTEKAVKVYIDGSATKIGAMQDGECENGPLKGKDQGSDRAEVRALLAALEKSTDKIK